MCKHRKNISKGNDTGIIGGDKAHLAKIPDLLKGTDIERAMGKIEDLERRADLLKKDLKSAKKGLGNALEA